MLLFPNRVHRELSSPEEGSTHVHIGNIRYTLYILLYSWFCCSCCCSCWSFNNAMITTMNSVVVVKLLTNIDQKYNNYHHSMIEISWLQSVGNLNNYYRWICSKNNRARVNTRRVCVTVFLSRRGCNQVPEALFVQTNSWKSRWFKPTDD